MAVDAGAAEGGGTADAIHGADADPDPDAGSVGVVEWRAASAAVALLAGLGWSLDARLAAAAGIRGAGGGGLLGDDRLDA